MRLKRHIGIWLCLLLVWLIQPEGALAYGSWYTAGQADGVYDIGTAAELRELAALVNDAEKAHSFAGETVRLTADIDLGGRDFVPIGYDSRLADAGWPFCGTFDGQGHTISGLKTVPIERPAEEMPHYHQALFGYAENAVIKNLKVIGMVESENDAAYVGGLVASFGGEQGLISNCVSEVQVKGKSFVGGIVGSISCKDLRLENCQNLGTVTAAGDYAGGLIGSANSNKITVSGSANWGTVSCANRSAGGLIGIADEVDLTDCANYGAVSGKNVVGGLLGDLDSMKYVVTVRRCFNAANISGETMVGGLFGVIEDKLPGGVSQCYSVGDVTGDKMVGGLAGRAVRVPFGDCFFYGKVTANEAGGSFGAFGTPGSGENCYALPGSLTVGGAPQPLEDWLELKTAAEFASGDVAWLLDGGTAYGRAYCWAQGETTPVFAAAPEQAVYYQKLTAEEAAAPGHINVIYHTNYAGGEEYLRETAPAGKSLTEPAPPTRPGSIGTAYRFAGWYTEPWLAARWDFSQPAPNEDLALYAAWQEVDLFAAGESAASPVLLGSVAELQALADKVALGTSYAGKYFKLANDITLDAAWQGIGGYIAPFDGNFDGGGHNVIMRGAPVGLFNFCGSNSTLQNINITGSMEVTSCPDDYPSYQAAFGGLAGSSKGTVKNCMQQLSANLRPAAGVVHFGGLVGMLEQGSMQDCRALQGAAISGAASGYVGGLIGYYKGEYRVKEIKTQIENCSSHAEISAQSQANGGLVGLLSGAGLAAGQNYGTVKNGRGAASGIVGASANGTANRIENCQNFGAIVGEQIAAGIMAAYAADSASNYSTSLQIAGAVNSGDITSPNGAAGGIFGSTAMSEKPSLGVSIVNSRNSGNISGKANVGGIAGMFDSLWGGMGAEGRDTAEIAHCENIGTVSADGDWVGGILGSSSYYSTLQLHDSQNSGDVSGANFVGGIAGYIDHNNSGSLDVASLQVESRESVAQNVFSRGNVTASGSYVGGLLGYGNLRHGEWQGEYINVLAGARFVNELVGDTRSLVVDSQYEYVPGVPAPVRVLETLPEPVPTDSAPTYTPPEDEQEQPPAISPLEPDTPDDEPKEDTPDEPAEEMTMFEVVRATVQQNPLISGCCLLLVLAVIALAGYNRYRRSRGR